MNPTTQESNKALVLEAFETLFNKRAYAAAERFWSLITSSTASTSSRGARDYSTSSKVYPQRSDMSRA